MEIQNQSIDNGRTFDWGRLSKEYAKQLSQEAGMNIKYLVSAAEDIDFPGRTAEYYLPNVQRLRLEKCDYALCILEQKDFSWLYLPEWGNAGFCGPGGCRLSE